MLGGAELDATTQYSYKGENVDTLIIDLVNRDVIDSTDSVSYYNAVLTNVPSINYETGISARAFIKLEKAGETTKYIYTDDTANRSISEVATAYYNDVTDEEEKESRTFSGQTMEKD